MHTTPEIFILEVPGMGSDHCAGIVRKSLERLDGVVEVKTNSARGRHAGRQGRHCKGVSKGRW